MNDNNELSQIDILNRQDFIEKIISTVEYHSKKNLNTSFSVQGEWGCGKSWILDRVFERLYDIQNEEIAGGRYCVFRYNAWKYDYYDEPLVSLLISLKEQFNSENSIIFKNQQMRENYEAAKKITAESLLNGIEILKETPLFSIIDSMTFHIPSFICLGTKIKKDFEKCKENVKNEIRQYDPHYDLNQLMNTLIDGLNKISKEKTIVVIVDELDRCLPEHAIKVLERMHHISQNVNNIQFIYGIDKTQIENNVAHIFIPEVYIGTEQRRYENEKKARIKNYLSKFITFGLEVPIAVYNGELDRKYSSLFIPFGKTNSCDFDLIEKIKTIVSSVTPRTLEQAIRKISLTNGILHDNDEKLDNSILCFELFYAISIELNFDWTNSYLSYDIGTNQVSIGTSVYTSFLCDSFNALVTQSPVQSEAHLRFQSDKHKLWYSFEDDGNKAKAVFESAMIYYFERIKGGNAYFFDYKEVTEEMDKNVDYIKQFCNYYKSLDM
jgi:hypothetical protein